MGSFFLFKIRSSCLECGENLAFEGPALAVPCRGCGATLDIPTATWKAILGFRENAAKFQLAEGQIRNSAMMGGGSGTLSVGWGPQRPLCSGCGTLLELSEAPPGTDGAIRCTACGGSTTTFPPPAWLSAVEPAAMQIFGAAREGVPAGQPVGAPVATRPVSFTCPDCGANLKVAEDTPRILGCSFCKADLFLPDPLWRTLHPVKKRVPWVVAFR